MLCVHLKRKKEKKNVRGCCILSTRNGPRADGRKGVKMSKVGRSLIAQTFFPVLAAVPPFSYHPSCVEYTPVYRSAKIVNYSQCYDFIRAILHCIILILWLMLLSLNLLYRICITSRYLYFKHSNFFFYIVFEMFIRLNISFFI